MPLGRFTWIKALLRLLAEPGRDAWRDDVLPDLVYLIFANLYLNAFYDC